jgi:hypothetical protein
MPGRRLSYEERFEIGRGLHQAGRCGCSRTPAKTSSCWALTGYSAS